MARVIPILQLEDVQFKYLVEQAKEDPALKRKLLKLVGFATETTRNCVCEICGNHFATQRRNKVTCSVPCSKERIRRVQQAKLKERREAREQADSQALPRPPKFCRIKECGRQIVGRPPRSSLCSECVIDQQERRREQANIRASAKRAPIAHILKDVHTPEKERGITFEAMSGHVLGVEGEVAAIFTDAAILRGTKDVLDEDDETLHVMLKYATNGGVYEDYIVEEPYRNPDDEARDELIQNSLRGSNYYTGIGCYGPQPKTHHYRP